MPRRITKASAVPPVDTTGQFEALLRETSPRQHYDLRLYITGSSPRSSDAIANIRALCDQRLAGHYTLEVVDIYQQPTAAFDEQIIAAPTLVKRAPKPPRRLIGNLANRDRVIVALNLPPPPKERKPVPKVTKWVEI